MNYRIQTTKAFISVPYTFLSYFQTYQPACNEQLRTRPELTVNAGDTIAPDVGVRAPTFQECKQHYYSPLPLENPVSQKSSVVHKIIFYNSTLLCPTLPSIHLWTDVSPIINRDALYYPTAAAIPFEVKNVKTETKIVRTADLDFTRAIDERDRYIWLETSSSNDIFFSRARREIDMLKTCNNEHISNIYGSFKLLKLDVFYYLVHFLSEECRSLFRISTSTTVCHSAIQPIPEYTRNET